MKIDYVVSCYFGHRRVAVTNQCTKKDKLFFVKRHVEVLNTLRSEHINKIIFVLNTDNEYDASMLKSYVSSVQSSIPVEFIINSNTGFSYRAWETVIIENIDDDVDYFFLIEDDYEPAVDFFYLYFIDHFSPYVGYVCELVFHNHPSGSNGIIRKDVCTHLLQKYGRVFSIDDKARSYDEGEDNQHNFLNYMLESGYIIKDVVSNYKILKMDHFGKVMTLGNINRDPVIKPIYCLDIKL